MLTEEVCPGEVSSGDSSNGKRKSGRWFEAIRRFDFCLSILGGNIGFSAIFQAPEPVPYVAFMAAVPALFFREIDNRLSAVCAGNFFATT